MDDALAIGLDQIQSAILRTTINNDVVDTKVGLVVNRHQRVLDSRLTTERSCNDEIFGFLSSHLCHSEIRSAGCHRPHSGSSSGIFCR